jgi:hypothetical protein
MWPVAILLIAIVEFYWFTFMGTIWCWVCAIADLLQGKFIRAAIWFSLGLGGLWWWAGTEDVDFDKWLHASYMFVALGATATFLRYLNRIIPSRLPPSEPAPFEHIELGPHADRRAVHDDLMALASALRGAIAGQGPRRISGPTAN